MANKWMSQNTYEWATSHMWMRHFAPVKELRQIYTWVMLHMYMSHVTHVNQTRHTCAYESCHTCACDTSHMCMSLVRHMNETRDTCIWITRHHEQLELHVSMCHTYESGTSNKQISRVTLPGISRERDPCWNRKQTYAETWKRDLEKRPRK